MSSNLINRHPKWYHCNAYKTSAQTRRGNIKINEGNTTSETIGKCNQLEGKLTSHPQKKRKKIKVSVNNLNNANIS